MPSDPFPNRAGGLRQRPNQEYENVQEHDGYKENHSGVGASRHGGNSHFGERTWWRLHPM